jgi:hypothetical protein
MDLGIVPDRFAQKVWRKIMQDSKMITDEIKN